MDIAFEQEEWLREALPTGRSGQLARPEWHELRARLVAAHQAWAALRPEPAGGLCNLYGSFDRSTAGHLVAFAEQCDDVNLVDSTNRNPGRDIDIDVAGTSSTGDRG